MTTQLSTELTVTKLGADIGARIDGVRLGGAPAFAEFAAAGVARVSLGSAIAQAAYAFAARATTEFLTHGTYDTTADGIPYDTTNQALSR